MTHFDVHWKGRPHHHLPRIRVASRTFVQSQKIPTTDEAVHARLNTKPVNAEKKPRFNLRFYRRRTRTSRSIYSATAAKRRASLRARQNIQVFGWNSPAAELASINTVKHPSVVNLERGSKLAETPIDAANSTTLVSTDGAGTSIIRRAREPRSGRRKTISRDTLGFDNKPLYWTSKQSERSTRDTVPLSPLEKPQQSSADHCPQVLRGTNSFDSRIAPSRHAPISHKDPTQPTRLSGEKRRIAATAVRRRRRRSRPFKNVDNPGFWDALSSVVSQSNGQAPTGRATVKSAVKSILSNTSSRTPSQRRALNRFKTELELYLQATRSLPKQSLVISPSVTTVSADTIEEFKPYHKEFQSAGLAVTSEEQRGMAFGKFDKSPKASTSTTKNAEKGKSVVKKSPPSFDSGSTGTTVMGFTPPHEKKVDQPRPTITRKPFLSDHTIIGFTPSHETPIQPVDSPPKTPTRKSLPWLRQAGTSVEAQPPTKKTNKSTVHADDVIKNMMLPTNPPLGPSSYETKAFPSRRPTEKSGGVTQKTPTMSHRSTGNRRQSQPEYDTEGSPVRDSRNDTKRHRREFDSENTTEARPYRTRDQYSDMATQTSEQELQRQSTVAKDTPPAQAVLTSGLSKTFPSTNSRCHGECQTLQKDIPFDELRPQRKSPIVEEITPPPPVLNSGRSRTFPLTMPKCHGECQVLETMAPIVESPSKPTRTSRVQWTGIDQAVQSEDVENLPPEEREDISRVSVPPSGRSSRFQSGPTHPTTQSSPTPTQVFQPRTPYKSVDERNCASFASRPCKELKISTTQPQASIPPHCTQCFCEVDHSQLPKKVEIPLEPQHEICFTPSEQPDHVCRARSSFQCQQCFPSRQASAVSPLQPASSISAEDSSIRTSIRNRPMKQGSVLQSPGCRDPSSTPEQKYSKPQSTAESPQYHDPPVPDPIKRPTVSKLKLRPAVAPAPAEKEIKSTRRLKELPKIPNPPRLFTTAMPFDMSSTLTSIDEYARQLNDVSDKAVFRGLHVATAAACDEDADKWIEDITGFSVREYLAELSKFEGLGYNTLAGVAKRAAKQRKNEARGWEVLRELRTREQVQSSSSGARLDKDEIQEQDNGTVRVRKSRNGQSPQADDVLQGMMHKRECKVAEDSKNRAARMGWRERSVSGT